jgi:sulfur relay (sulfurtransferase) DsrF/TusC family protein
MMRILNIVETAYRATLEEQDDTVLWLSRALTNAGAELTVLLRGNAVNYVVRQSCAPLAIGSVTINHPARPNEDLAKLHAKGAGVYVVQDDLDERGIDKQQCVAEATPIRRAEVVELMEQHDQVWHW